MILESKNMTEKNWVSDQTCHLVPLPDCPGLDWMRLVWELTCMTASREALGQSKRKSQKFHRRPATKLLVSRAFSETASASSPNPFSSSNVFCSLQSHFVLELPLGDWFWQETWLGKRPLHGHLFEHLTCWSRESLSSGPRYPSLSDRRLRHSEPASMFWPKPRSDH